MPPAASWKGWPRGRRRFGPLPRHPESPYLDAAANVSVAKIDFKSIEVGIEPLPVAVGRASRLRLDAVADDGKR